VTEELVVKYKDYELPEPGTYNAELIEVIDRGIVGTAFGDKHRIAHKYKLEQLDSQGENLTVLESFNFTFGKGSRLLARVTKLLGGKPPKGFKLNSLVGWTGQVTVEHEEGSDGRVYANVASVVPSKKVKAAAPPWEAPDGQ
jgi:hypothetical protein